MGIEKYNSEVKSIQYNQQLVFNALSNLKNLEQLFDPQKLAELKERIPDAPDIKVEEFRATENECTFKIQPLGTVGIEIVEKEPFKTIKYEGSESVPFKFNFWVQLLPSGDDSCHCKLTLHADLNIMIKMVVGKYLEDGINKIADAVTKIPFDRI